jgi:TonB family protein
MPSAGHTLALRTRPEGELAWTIGVSALAHGVGIALLALAPARLPRPVPVESYTVDLIAPSVIGGTNRIAGPNSQGKPAAASPSSATAAQPDVILPKARPPAETKRAATKPKPSEPESARSSTSVEPKPREQPKAQAAKEEGSKPEPETVSRPPVAVAAKSAAPKAKQRPGPKPAEPGQSAVPGAPEKPVAEGRAAHAVGSTRSPNPAARRDREIAAAVERRAQQLSGASKTPAGIDERIAEAVGRRARLVDPGVEGKGTGGPISHGPGTGAGGIVKGIEYVLYRTHMEDRIKSAWVWAGANQSLRAVVRFGILPNGEIVDIQILISSGDRSYDASIERALRGANPLDPPPAQYRDEFATVELEFRPEDLRS